MVSLAKSVHTSGNKQEPGAFDQDKLQTTQAAAGWLKLRVFLNGPRSYVMVVVNK